MLVIRAANSWNFSISLPFLQLFILISIIMLKINKKILTA